LLLVIPRSRESTPRGGRLPHARTRRYCFIPTSQMRGCLRLDAALRRTVEERLRDHADSRRLLFKVNAPLGNLEPKITLGFMLYAFDRQARKAMYGLAEARNLFAHRHDMSFDSSDDPKMTAALEKLTLHEGRKFYPHHHTGADTDMEIGPVPSSRERFLVNLQLALIGLMVDRMSHQKWTAPPPKDEVQAGTGPT